MKKILYISALFLLFASARMDAQTNTSLTYSMGFATGDLADFISKASFRGATLDFRKMARPDLGIGFSLGWNTFYEEKPYDTYTYESQSLSGKQYRYSNHVPMLISFDYYMKPGEKISPFVGLGTGVTYTRRNTDMNLYTLEQDAWNFSLQPQIGVQLNNSLTSATTIMLKYYYGLKAGDFDKAQSYLALNVGFVFRQP